MRFLVKFLLLVSVKKDIDFFSMYDDGFLLIRTNSLEGALAYLKGGAPIDAILIEAGPDDPVAIERCATLKKAKPSSKLVLLADPEGALPDDVKADVVLDKAITDTRLSDALVEVLIDPHARQAWACGSSTGYIAQGVVSETFEGTRTGDLELVGIDRFNPSPRRQALL